MKYTIIALVLCAYVWAGAADVAHVKGVKKRILSRLTGKHHKRGILSPVPPFKLGHDIPYVTHSVVKPLVVTYPPTASVAAVKIPVSGPHLPHYPAPVGHKVHGLPHPHYGLKFPHNKVIGTPDHHYHHHHHHVAPRPVIPVVPEPLPVTPVTHATPVVPAPPPTIAVAHTVPAPPSPLVPVPVFPPNPVAVPAASVQIAQDHLHVKPLLPAAAVPIPSTPVLSPPVLPFAQSFPYVIRPGNALQTSFFANYPRYPFLNGLQSPFLPVAPAAPIVPTLPQVLLNRPHLHQYPLLQPAAAHGVIEQPQPNVVVEQAPNHFHSTQIVPQPSVHLHPAQEALPQPGFHLHSTQIVPQASFPLQPTQPTVPLEHDGWSPVPASPQPQDLPTPHEGHVHQQSHHFTQEQGTQVYEHHTENQYHDFQHQLQQHIQHQIEQAQYEQNLQNQQQQHPAPEYGVPHQNGQEYSQQEYVQQAQHTQDFAEHGQNFGQHEQDFGQHGQQFLQHGQDLSQNGQDFGQHGQQFLQHAQDHSQNGQDFNQLNYNGQVSQEYGLPHQGVEGRSSDDNEQQYHNHIPLGLQPPLDRPLDHFH